MSYESQKVSILGQVNNQSLVPLDRPYSVTELLARAGGLTGDAGDTAFIVRQGSNGQSVREELDLVAILSGSRMSPLLRAGDVLFVPRGATVSVVGAVTRAGVFKVAKGMSVQQAIALAGDITRLGTSDNVRIRRLLPDGTRSTVSVPLDDPVHDGDVIMVKERLF